MTAIGDLTANAVAVAPFGGQRRYVGILTSITAQRMQRLIAPFGFAIETCDADAFLEHLNDPAHVCAIIEPAALDQDRLVETVARLRQLPRPAVVCAPALADGIQDAMRIALETGAAVAVPSIGQDRAALARTILSVAPPTDAAMLLELLAPMLAKLPSMLRTTFVAMFAADAAVQSPESLASRAGVSRRSLDRWLARTGAPSARRLAALPLTLRALRLLRETVLPIRTTAAICGFRSPRRMHDYTVDFTGLTPNELRAGTQTMETLISTIARSLHAHR